MGRIVTSKQIVKRVAAVSYPPERPTLVQSTIRTELSWGVVVATREVA